MPSFRADIYLSENINIEKYQSLSKKIFAVNVERTNLTSQVF